MEQKEFKEGVKRLGESELGRQILETLRHRYPTPSAWEIQSWEQQRLLAGQQKVLADLTKLLAKGEI